MEQTDALGRATFYHIAPVDVARPTEREIRWLKHIERHGPQSSQYLFELTRDSHRCKDTALRALQKLRAAKYLKLPPQQRATERAECKPFVYDLTAKAKDHLVDRGIDEATVRPSGHWWHGYAVSCVTSAIDISAARDGVRYIPAHNILAIKSAQLAIPLGKSKLVPDQLFALDYGGSYRAFALEVDRGTEPLRSSAARKSIQKSLDLYYRLIHEQVYKQHYGLKANILVLWAFQSRKRQEQLLSMASELPTFVARSMLSLSYDFEKQYVAPLTGGTGPYHRPWCNAGGGSTSLALEAEP
ncbi:MULTISPECIES: replication-relaxation family protein [Roseobacteraceae]|uniref:replication-relaxation family protein n=1 Tax=Roseobacteraceae TaxID=2854170 RepID=UPI002B275CF4|nr:MULTISPECIES: replication-relaxation family protein [Roseobacteraceae]